MDMKEFNPLDIDFSHVDVLPGLLQILGFIALIVIALVALGLTTKRILGRRSE